MMEISLNGDQTFTLANKIVVTELDGEAVLLDNTNGQYFGLNTVGNFVLQKIKQGKNFDDICESTYQEFDAQKQDISNDIVQLLTDMLKAGILI